MSVFRRSFKAIVVAAAALLCGAAAPQRIMSLNICTDQLLLALAPEKRIASLTFLAREKQPLRYWPQAARIPVNYGSAEDVLAVRPDLVLTGPFQPALSSSR